VITAFSELNKGPAVEVTVNGMKMDITATPVAGTSIKTIEVLKDGASLKKVNYKSSYSYTANSAGVYTVKVTSSSKDVTTKEVTLNPVVLNASYSLLGAKAEIIANAQTKDGNNITKIEITGPEELSEFIENQGLFRLEVLKNGVYAVKAIDSEGNEKSVTLEISGINEEFYITLEADDSEIASKGTVKITATVQGEFDEFYFGETPLLESPAVVTVNKDGNYVFTAKKDDTVITSNIVITAFSELNKGPAVEVTVNGMKMDITATPVAGTSIKTIEVLKDGASLKKVNYKSSYSYTANSAGVYTVKVTSSNKDVMTKEVTIE
jgi:hypothetical protein